MTLDRCIETEATIVCVTAEQAKTVCTLLRYCGLLDNSSPLDKSHNHIKMERKNTYRRVWQGLKNRVTYSEFINTNFSYVTRITK